MVKLRKKRRNPEFERIRKEVDEEIRNEKNPPSREEDFEEFRKLQQEINQEITQK